MGMRVATFASSDRMLNASLATQARMSNLQMQQASGSISTNYGGLGSDTRPLLDLEATLKTSQSYADAAKSAGGRVEVMYSALSSITDLLTDFRATLVGKEKDVAIFDLRLVADDPLTLQDLGDRFGISRERVRQLEQRLLGRLRDYLKREMGDATDSL